MDEEDRLDEIKDRCYQVYKRLGEILEKWTNVCSCRDCVHRRVILQLNVDAILPLIDEI